MAYNDFGTPSRYDNSVTRIGVTSAELKAGSGSVEKTGKLIDFGTDQVSGIQLKITISGSPLGQAQISGDAPADTVVRLTFPSHGGQTAQLRVRNGAQNEDEDGAPNMRGGSTNYFVFPGDSGADAAWLQGAGRLPPRALGQHRRRDPRLPLR